MRTRPRRISLLPLSLIFAILVALPACGGGSVVEPPREEDPEEEPEGPPIPPPGPHFTVSPIPVSTLARITPLGYNNNVFPTPHTYWTTCDFDYILQSELPCHRERQQIVAPGSGRVRDIQPGPDGAVVVEGPPGLVWTMGHVTPADISIGDTIIAGQHVATMFYEHGFDLGLWNNGVSHDFIDSDRYPAPAQHAEHPIAQFPEPLRTELTTRIRMMDGPPFGRVNYDVEGTASGGWIIEGAPPGDVPLHGENEYMLLFLGRYTERQSTRILGFGEAWPGMLGLDNGTDAPARDERFTAILAVDSAAPDWEEITPASGVVALRLWGISRDAFPNLDRAFGSVLVEMVDEDTIRIEWFHTHDEVTAFTSAARTYER